MPQPVPHSLIFNNVVIGILDFVFFHDLEHLAGEPTFRIGWRPLGKNYHRTAFHNILGLWMPYKHIFLKLLLVFFGGLAQQVKQTANVIFFIAIQDLLITLSEDHCGSLLNVEFLQSFR